MSTRILENPLFDEYVEAMVPYVQRHELWHQNWNREHGVTDSEDTALERLTWDIGRSTAALESVLNAVRGVPARSDEELKEVEALISPFRARHELVVKYAWAIPTAEAIDKIVEHSPHGVVEIGAGGGYWAMFLRARGVHVMAYDHEPDAHLQVAKIGGWSPVAAGGPAKAALWPQHSLFLCWPPYDDPMAFDALCAYSGDTLLYIGEDSGGCTGDEKFHELLESEWTELEDESVWLPQWPGIHDLLWVYKRKEKA